MADVQPAHVRHPCTPLPAESELTRRRSGANRFYLYDTAASESLAEILLPFIADGSVVLHQMTFSSASAVHAPNGLMACADDDEKRLYDVYRLDYSIRNYGPTAEWMINIDVDEFMVLEMPLYRPQIPYLGNDGEWLFPLHDLLATPPWAEARCVPISRNGMSP